MSFVRRNMRVSTIIDNDGKDILILCQEPRTREEIVANISISFFLLTSFLLFKILLLNA